MHQYPEELYADFRQYYGLRLTDVLDGSLPVWEAAVLASQLPPDSRTVAMTQGGKEFWGWTLDRHIWLSILEAVQVDTYAFVQANSRKKIKPPKKVERPGDEERRAQEKQNNPFALMVAQQMSKLRADGEKNHIVIED